MKRFLSVFVTSMFLASAAFAADPMKDEKKAAEPAKVADTKGDAKAKAGDTKGDAKAGAMKEEKKAN